MKRSFWKNVVHGASTVLVVWPVAGHPYLRSVADRGGDLEALKEDVRKIGADYYKAFGVYEQKEKESAVKHASSHAPS